MPQVAGKDFPYTADGIAAAKAESRRTGAKVRPRKGMSYRSIARAQGKRARTGKRDLSGAVKRPGALTAAVGGKPSENAGRVRALAANGSPLQKKEAAFYLNVLKK